MWLLPHTPNSSKSLYSSLFHSLFHYPLHCSRTQGCLLYHSFTPRLSRPLCLYLVRSRQFCFQQLTWTVLPQDFRDNPHFLGQAQASDLTSPDLTPSTVLQYVNDLLLCSPSFTYFQQHTIQLLNFLADRGY